MATVDASSERIAGVVDSLKRFVAVDEAENKRVDLRDGIEGSLTLLAPALEGIDVQLELPEQPIMILCSPSKLNHAILELLRRGVEAMGAEGTLRIALEAGNETAVVCIDDGGCLTGDALFDFAFSEEDGHMRMQLGLPLAKNNIEELGGTITISASGGGTRTCVTLPR